MRGLLLAASLVAVLALPTRLRTRANAAETALADTKVDGDRFLRALQRLDADLEESERRHLRPKTRELERTDRTKIDCKNMITAGMTASEAFVACAGTTRLTKIKKNAAKCYFFAKKGAKVETTDIAALWAPEGTGWRHRCSSHPKKQLDDGWIAWNMDHIIDKKSEGKYYDFQVDKIIAKKKAKTCLCMATAWERYYAGFAGTLPDDSVAPWKKMKLSEFGGKAVKVAGLATLQTSVWNCVDGIAKQEAGGDSAEARAKGLEIARDRIARCGFGEKPMVDAGKGTF